MRVVLRYFDDCANWREAEATLRGAMECLGMSPGDLVLERIESLEHAERVGFRGSPTILLNGRDPFEDPLSSVGLACRFYSNASGRAGSPDLAALVHALREADGHPDAEASELG